MLQAQTKAQPKVWIGIDFHKKTWRIHCRTEDFSGNPFSMEPNPDILKEKVDRDYPGYDVEIVYECGCFGYWSHRKFVSYGWHSIVVNPADIPRMHKDRYEKSDTIDARKLSKYLKKGLLKGVTIPDIKREQLRSLFRRRVQLVKNIRSVKVILKSQLIYFGIKIPPDMDNANWTGEFRQWVKDLEWEHETSAYMMQSNIEQVEYLHYKINDVGSMLRKYCRDNYKHDYELLQSIPGIGPLTAICFISEIGDVSRFKNFKQLSCLVGLMPTTYQSSETNRSQGLTPRALRIMRSYLVESAWQAVRIDPVLREYYNGHKGKKPNDIIVKVARKLLSRAYAILRTGVPYEIGLVK
jgi:transposase